MRPGGLERHRDNPWVTAPSKEAETRVATEDPTLLDALSDAVESGAGLPAVARAAARLLDASVALIDRSSAVLAVAGASPDQEERLLSGGEGVNVVELRVADTAVGELRYRAKAPPAPSIARMVTTLLALELERSRAPEWASEEVAGRLRRRCPLPPRHRSRRHRRPRRRARRRPRPRRRRPRPPRLAACRADGGVARPRPDPRPARPALARARRPGDHRGRRARRRSRGDRPRRGRRAARPRRRRARPRARRQPLRLPRHDRPQPPLPPTRSTSTGRARRRASRSTSARPRAGRCSPSRTPAPTACCCRR